MSERSYYLATIVAKVDGDVDSIFWHRHQEYILESLACGFSLRIAEPFLEKGREGVAINGVSRLVVLYRDLTVALHR